MKLVVANWKMNPETEREAVELAKKEDFKGVVLMPPLSFLAPVGDVLKKAKLGAQDVFYEEEGAYTGEVSPEQLKSLGVKYVLIGHSERRALGETDEVINKKVLAALKEGLRVVLCVGEKERKVKSEKLKIEKEFVKQQLESALDKVALRQAQGIRDNEPRLIVAYEPVWAISTRSHGRSDSPEDAVNMVSFIKETLRQAQGIRLLVLYGGSVNSGDAEGFLEREEIDGVLVGAASLDAGEFGKIVKAAGD